MLEIMPNVFATNENATGDSPVASSLQKTQDAKLTDADRERIAAKIQRYWKVHLTAGRRTLSSAYRIGVELNAVHDSLAHGEWILWVERNTRIKTRTANNWRTLAKHRNLVIFGLRHRFTITEVLNQISEINSAKTVGNTPLAAHSRKAAIEPVQRSAISKVNAYAVEHLRSLCNLLKIAPDEFPEAIQGKLSPLIEQFVTQVERILGGEA